MTIHCKSFVLLILLFLIAGSTATSANPPPEYLDQGWSESQRDSWYTTSQGSRLLPLAWFRTLELPGSGEKLASPSNMRRYGYLASYVKDANLPVGFAVDTGPSPDKSTVEWVGMTCAACHTGEMTYQGKRFRVDGAPTLADFETFMSDFTAALKATGEEPERFDRFALAVLGSQLQPGKAQLKTDLQTQVDWYARLADKNRSSVRYGHGRLDAQGHILNKVSLIVGVSDPLPGYPSDAPASYPFLWYTPKQEQVQWNGLVPQEGTFGFGEMFRNIGQVIGVFASVDVASHQTKYPSSVRKGKLQDLESLAAVLQPPKWPETILPKLGPLSDGGHLFKQHCSDCHNLIERTTGDPVWPDRPIAKMKALADIGTDIWLACNTFRHTSKLGKLEGRIKDPKTHEVVSVAAKTSWMLTNVVREVFFGTFGPPPGGPPGPSALEEHAKLVFFGSRERSLRQMGVPVLLTHPKDARSEAEGECRAASRNEQEALANKLAYKAGPLNGIWATAPYLHNGSVPTLADLLLPPSQRPPTFRVGSTEFDSDRVGFTTKEGPFEFRVRDANGKVIPGNDNSGHDHGTSLDDGQRKALLEYLKSL
jgi:hypothetical protein